MIRVYMILMSISIIAFIVNIILKDYKGALLDLICGAAWLHFLLEERGD